MCTMKLPAAAREFFKTVLQQVCHFKVDVIAGDANAAAYKHCKNLHREALQADLQQKNVYNPFSDESKAMIREMNNVELFELCETIPKVQCSERLLYWNQGMVY